MGSCPKTWTSCKVEDTKIKVDVSEKRVALLIKKYDFLLVPVFDKGKPSSSKLWVPCNREEWDECSDEITSLCTFASTKTIIPEEFIRD